MKNLSDVKLFLMDMDGTIYHGDKPINGAFQKIEELRTNGYKVKFLTNNSSKSPQAYVKKLNDLGLNATEADILTSGQVTINYLLREHPSKKVFLVGTDSLYDQFKAMGIPLSYDNADIVVLGFDKELTYDKMYRACRYLYNGTFYISTHPDMVCPAPLGDMPDVGALIKLLESVTGRAPDIICGKPHSQTAITVGELYNFKPHQIAMVGDRLYTDIAFGINNDLFSILVLSGETTAEMLAESDLKPDLILDTFSELNL